LVQLVGKGARDEGPQEHGDDLQGGKNRGGKEGKTDGEWLSQGWQQCPCGQDDVVGGVLVGKGECERWVWVMHSSLHSVHSSMHSMHSVLTWKVK
jgi:hypothetical protein